MNFEKLKDTLFEVKTLVDDKVIQETLTRIGIANRDEKIIYPSCYLVVNDNKKYIVHFKQLFLMTRENAYNNICEDDLLRIKSVVFCLKQWGLVEIDESLITPHTKHVFVLPYNQKKEWKILHKFNFKTIN